MGTGILSILLFNSPYQFNGLHVIAGVIFAINIIVFVVLLVFTILRYAIWPSLLPLMLTHPVNLFLGTFPMGLDTLITMIVNSLVPRYGYNYVLLAYVLWYISVAISIITCVGIPFIQMSRQNVENRQIFATALLPTVSTIVAASTGASVATVLPDSQARITIVISYILLGMGLPISVLLMANYSYRLILFKLPQPAFISSTFITIGPCGQSAYAILKLSSDVNMLISKTGLVPFTGVRDEQAARLAGIALQTVSIPMALFIWGFGVLWFFFAVISFADTWAAKKIPLNLSLWACTFPIGTLALSAQELGKEMDSTGMKVVGTILMMLLLIIWLLLFPVTLYFSVIKDSWFTSPCLSEVGGQPPSFEEVDFIKNRKY
ncbi:hypothetical protein E3P77_02312 [Wallemia ichthyophaga]|nr:hypothetical protein E3P77_02312 [Wallemia ichthyophaga]